MRLAVALLALVACVLVVSANVPSPTIEGPIGSPAGAFLQSTSFDLALVGYQQAEFFLSGTASAYTNVGPLGADGLWTVAPAGNSATGVRMQRRLRRAGRVRLGRTSAT